MYSFLRSLDRIPICFSLLGEQLHLNMRKLLRPESHFHARLIDLTLIYHGRLYETSLGKVLVQGSSNFFCFASMFCFVLWHCIQSVKQLLCVPTSLNQSLSFIIISKTCKSLDVCTTRVYLFGCRVGRDS